LPPIAYSFWVTLVSHRCQAKENSYTHFAAWFGWKAVPLANPIVILLRFFGQAFTSTILLHKSRPPLLVGIGRILIGHDLR